MKNIFENRGTMKKQLDSIRWKWKVKGSKHVESVTNRVHTLSPMIWVFFIRFPATDLFYWNTKMVLFIVNENENEIIIRIIAGNLWGLLWYENRMLLGMWDGPKCNTISIRKRATILRFFLNSTWSNLIWFDVIWYGTMWCDIART